MKKAWILFMLMLACVSANVESTTIVYEGLGIGQAREEAINNALSDALGKMRGVSVSKQVSSNDTINATGGKEDVNFQTNVQVKTSIAGKTPPYKLVYANQQGDGSWEASITIAQTQKRYTPPGLDSKSRRSITVVGSDNNPGYELLKQKIITALNKSRKFNVLDRDTQFLYDQEKTLMMSVDAQKDELLKLGNVLGTDYILYVTVSGATMGTKVSKLTGKVVDKAEMNIEYRVLLMATRQIKFSGSLLVSGKGEGPKAVSDILGRAADEIVTNILNAIYPLKVASVQNDTVVFSQSLTVDRIYECFSLGERVIDSYTKESAGQIEDKVGEVQVTRADPKISYAKILSGKVAKGNICRPVGGGNGEFLSGEGKASEAEVLEGGGVNVGF